MKIGDIIDCKIIGIQPYGLFVTYDDYEGLIHISEISDLYIPSLSEIFVVGDELKVKVIEVYEDQKRLKLSYKDTHKIHPRIQKVLKIRKGFHPLNQSLDGWIEKKKGV
jgi:general stress protein 13